VLGAGVSEGVVEEVLVDGESLGVVLLSDGVLDGVGVVEGVPDGVVLGDVC
jgi:hypothetical protein